MAAVSGGKTQYLLPPRRILSKYEPGNYHLYRGQTFDLINSTRSLIIVYVTAKKNSYTLVESSAAAGCGLDGASASARLRWIADARVEETQRLLLSAGESKAVTPQTKDGVYLSVCKEMDLDGAPRDVLLGDMNLFVKRADRITLYYPK